MRKRNSPENHYTNKKRPCTTTLKMNLLSSILLSCLDLSCLLFSCLSSSVFSSLSVPVFFLCLCLSLSVSVCLCLSLSPCGVSCVTRFETPCVHSTRLRVYVQNVTVCTGTTRTHVSTCVRVVPVQTGTF